MSLQKLVFPTASRSQLPAQGSARLKSAILEESAVRSHRHRNFFANKRGVIPGSGASHQKNGLASFIGSGIFRGLAAEIAQQARWPAVQIKFYRGKQVVGSWRGAVQLLQGGVLPSQ